MPATEPINTTTIPTMRRRLCAMVYELLLLCAIEMLAVLLYIAATGNQQSTSLQYGLRAFLFLITGLYFCWSWVDSGHTLAMKTWRLRVVEPGRARLSWTSAIKRYLLAWGWFAPALLVCAVFDITSKSGFAIALVTGMAAWAGSALLDPRRRLLHERLSGTEVILLPKPVRAGRAKAVKA